MIPNLRFEPQGRAHCNMKSCGMARGDGALGDPLVQEVVVLA